MTTAESLSRKSVGAAAIVAVTALTFAVALTPAALAQSPGNTQRYQGPGTITGTIPTLPGSIAVDAALGVDVGPDSDVFVFDIGASAAGQDVTFSGVNVRNVDVMTGTDGSLDIEFEARLRASVLLGADTIVAETQDRIPFAVTIAPDGTGQIESQGPPMPVVIQGQTNPVGEIENIVADLTVVCADSSAIRCLSNGRFKVEIDWRDFADNTGQAMVVPFGSNDSGLFYFFNLDNWEMLLKILNGCSLNDYFWVFAAATTNVEYEIVVTDTANGTEKRYFNPLAQAPPAITDTQAFATCP